MARPRVLIAGLLVLAAVIAAGLTLWYHVHNRPRPISLTLVPVPEAAPKPGKPKSASERRADLKGRVDALAKEPWSEKLFGKYEAIIQDARALQQGFPGTKEALESQELVIVSYEKQGKFPERFEAFLRYVEMGEKVYDRDLAAKILLLEGNRNFKNKEFMSAHRFYEEVLSRYPEGKVADIARFQVGRCFEEVGEWQVAIRKYQAIIDAPTEKSGMKLDARKQTYEILARRGRSKEAIDALQGIHDHYKGAPEERWAHLEKGAYLWRLGKNAEALRVLHEVRKLYPDATEARRAEQYIKQIEAGLTKIDKDGFLDLPK